MNSAVPEMTVDAARSAPVPQMASPRSRGRRVVLGPPPIQGPRCRWRGVLTTTAATEAALDLRASASVDVAVGQFEQLVGDNNLRSVSFIREGARLAGAVAQVVVPSGVATGFLIGHEVLITNNHVLPSPEVARTARAKFNYEVDIRGNLLPTSDYACRPDELFATNKRLDYTVVAVEGSPGRVWGIVPLRPGTGATVGDRVNIIQHPDGQPKQLAIVDNEVAYFGDVYLQYLTDTLPGSSGSPVFLDDWTLVGLHHSGGWIPEPASASTHFRNEGIRMSAIYADLHAVGLI